MKSKLFNYGVRFGMSSNVIKVIAILIMTFDHFCKIILYWLANNVLYNSQNFRLIYKLIFSVFYEIGQMAFPLFAFLLAQGFLHTKNIYKYFFSLLSFGFISEIFFDLAFYNNLVYLQHQNVFFTLSFGLLLLFTLKKVQLKFNNDFLSNFAIQATLCCLFMFLSFILNFDHGVRGLLLILIFYYSSDSFFTLTASNVAASFDTFANKHPASFAISSSLDGSLASVISSSIDVTFPSRIPPLIL